MNIKEQMNRITYRARIGGLLLRPADWIHTVASPKKTSVRAERVNLLRNTCRLYGRINALRRNGTFPAVRHVPSVVRGIHAPTWRLFAGRGA